MISPLNYVKQNTRREAKKILFPLWSAERFLLADCLFKSAVLFKMSEQ